MIPIIQLLKIASKIVRGTLLLIVDHVLDFKVNFFGVLYCVKPVSTCFYTRFNGQYVLDTVFDLIYTAMQSDVFLLLVSLQLCPHISFNTVLPL